MKLNVKKFFSIFMCFGWITTIIAPVSYAAAPDFVNNTTELLSDALTWVLILVPVAGGLMIGWHSLQKNMADGDGGEIADRDKKIKMILVSSVIAFIGLGVVKAVVAYYQ